FRHYCSAGSSVSRPWRSLRARAQPRALPYNPMARRVTNPIAVQRPAIPAAACLYRRRIIAVQLPISGGAFADEVSSDAMNLELALAGEAPQGVGPLCHHRGSLPH